MPRLSARGRRAGGRSRALLVPTGREAGAVNSRPLRSGTVTGDRTVHSGAGLLILGALSRLADARGRDNAARAFLDPVLAGGLDATWSPKSWRWR